MPQRFCDCANSFTPLRYDQHEVSTWLSAQSATLEREKIGADCRARQASPSRSQAASTSARGPLPHPDVPAFLRASVYWACRVDLLRALALMVFKGSILDLPNWTRCPRAWRSAQRDR